MIAIAKDAEFGMYNFHANAGKLFAVFVAYIAVGNTDQPEVHFHMIPHQEGYSASNIIFVTSCNNDQAITCHSLRRITS